MAQIDCPRAGDRYSLVVVFVRQMSTKFHPAQIFVIAKFHVTKINYHYNINIQALSLSYILCQVPSDLSGTTAGNRLARVTL